MKMRAVQVTSKIKLAGRSAAAAALLMCLVSRSVIAQDRAGAKDWPTGSPKEFGIDPEKLAAFDADLASGKYGLVDSMLVLRCGSGAPDVPYLRFRDCAKPRRHERLANGLPERIWDRP